jgi:hypothetical protein
LQIANAATGAIFVIGKQPLGGRLQQYEFALQRGVVSFRQDA